MLRGRRPPGVYELGIFHINTSRHASVIAAGGELLSSSHLLSPAVPAVTPAHILLATGTCRTAFNSQQQGDNERRGTGA